MRREMDKKGSKIELFFKDKQFCFLPFGNNFGKNRAEIMTDLVKKRGGSVLPTTSLTGTSPHDVIVITSKDIATFSALRKLLPNNITNPEDYLYIDCEWISKCMLANRMVDHCSFCLNLPGGIESTSENSKDAPFPQSPSANGGADPKKTDKSPGANKNETNKGTNPNNPVEEEDKVEYHNHKAMQTMLDKLRAEQKSKIIIECRHLYDYLYDIQFPDFYDSDDEYEFEEGCKLSDEDKTLDELEIQFLGARKKKLRFTNDFYNNFGDTDKSTQGNPEEISVEQKDFKYYKAYNKRQREIEFWKKKRNTFVCQTGTDKSTTNDHITKELEKMLKIYTNQKDNGRMLAYRRAITILKAQKHKIESEESVRDLPGIGKRIKEKIMEILTTGKIRKAEMLTTDEKTRCIEELTRVWGIGVQTASNFYQKGIRTVEDLRRNQNLLNDNQRVGLKYLEEFEKRIPRDEVTQIVDFVKAKIEELSDIKGIYEVICCGSYRRGKPTCGDIDILITRKDEHSFSGFLGKLIKGLGGVLLTDHLALPIKRGSHGCETYMGVCSYKGGPHRRIDIKVYPREQFGFAILYFTGSDWFNRSMRLWARKLGYTLGDHGLYPSVRSKNEKVWVGQNIPCYTEEEVFKALNLDYKTPSERDIG